MIGAPHGMRDREPRGYSVASTAGRRMFLSETRESSLFTACRAQSTQGRVDIKIRQDQPPVTVLMSGCDLLNSVHGHRIHRRPILHALRAIDRRQRRHLHDCDLAARSRVAGSLGSWRPASIRFRKGRRQTLHWARASVEVSALGVRRETARDRRWPGR